MKFEIYEYWYRMSKGSFILAALHDAVRQVASCSPQDAAPQRNTSGDVSEPFYFKIIVLDCTLIIHSRWTNTHTRQPTHDT